MRKYFTSVRNERHGSIVPPYEGADRVGRVTQCANKEQWSHTRSKDLGVRVRQWIDRNGEDRLEVYLTGGTNSPDEISLLFTDEGPIDGDDVFGRGTRKSWQRMACRARGQEYP